MKLELLVEGETIKGELAIAIAPGTLAKVQSRAIDDALGPELEARARELGVVLGAAPSRYTRQLPGKDAEGRTRFEVRARSEGDRLLPVR